MIYLQYMTNDEVREVALEFLKKNKVGVLATISPEGGPHASLIYYVCDDSFNIYFSTLESTRKFDAISHNPRAAFTVATVDIPQTLQIEGDASEITGEEKIKDKLSNLIEILESNNTYYWPITKMGALRVVLMKLTPTWVRWGNFALQQEEDVFNSITIAHTAI